MINFADSFHENFHMNHEMFELLYSKVERHLQPKRNTRIDGILPRERLAIALEYVYIIS